MKPIEFSKGERAAVAGGDDVVHTLTFTRHGPVVHVDVENRRAAAVRDPG